MSEKEQNKKINELNRRVARLEATVKRTDLDLEPNGRISNAFDAVEEHLDRIEDRLDGHDKKLDKLQYDINQANGKLDAIKDKELLVYQTYQRNKKPPISRREINNHEKNQHSILLQNTQKSSRNNWILGKGK